MPNHRINEEGVQLNLFDGLTPLAEFQDETVLRKEARTFRQRQVSQRNLGRDTARVRSAYLAGMVRTSKSGTVARFLQDPETVVSQIRRGSRRVPEAKHLAVLDYIELCTDLLPPGTATRCLEFLDTLFPARTTPRPGLVDRSLGGSRKQVRVEVPLPWAAGDRIIEMASAQADARFGLRDSAFAAMLLRSGLRPSVALSLRWQDVLPLLGGDSEIADLSLVVRGRTRIFAVHETAASCIRRLWLATGRPASGPVFVRLRKPVSQLGSYQAATIVARAVRFAGLPPVDMRHMRRQFARWLIAVKGWNDVEVRDALGLDELSELYSMMTVYEDVAAQQLVSEFVGLGLDPADVDSSVGILPNAATVEA